MQVIYYDEELKMLSEVHSNFYNDGYKGANKLTLLYANFTNENNVFVIFKQINRKKGKQMLLGNFVDLHSGEFQFSQHKLITEIPIDAKIEDYRFSKNPERDLFLMEFHTRLKKTSTKLKTNFVVFNSDLDFVWKYESRHSQVFTKFESTSSLITDKGKVLSFININDGKGSYEKDDEERSVLYIQILSEDGEEKDFVIKLEKNQYLSKFTT
ncbi:MAG: hypothetical protein K8R67_03185, partial [Desulfobacteraceae bacterium]|nr:hypothetical protein [Desulfobacteraceae bacterium]